jgi:hypothetical protein
MVLAPSNHGDVLDRINSVKLIDSAERFDIFDVQAVGVTATLIDGMELEIPPQQRSWRVRCKIPAQLLTGTAASGTLQSILLYLYDSTSGTDVGPYDQDIFSCTAGAVTNRQWNKTMMIDRIFDPTTTSRYLRLLTRTIITTPSGWSQALLQGADSPVSGNTPPMLFYAESIND